MMQEAFDPTLSQKWALANQHKDKGHWRPQRTYKT